MGSWFYNHKDLNSANPWLSLETDSSPEPKANALTPALWELKQRTRGSLPRLRPVEHEIINGHHFQPVSLWSFVTVA